jgi:hypothetical protein
MNIPPAEIIEGAIEQFDSAAYTRTDTPEADEVKELNEAIGAADAKKLQIAFPLAQNFVVGYQLGLDVARRILLGNMTLAMRGVDPKALL